MLKKYKMKLGIGGYWCGFARGVGSLEVELCLLCLLVS